MQNCNSSRHIEDKIGHLEEILEMTDPKDVVFRQKVQDKLSVFKLVLEPLAGGPPIHGTPCPEGEEPPWGPGHQTEFCRDLHSRMDLCVER